MMHKIFEFRPSVRDVTMSMAGREIYAPTGSMEVKKPAGPV